MIQIKVHRCRYCGNVVKMKVEDGYITEVDGADQYKLFTSYKSVNNWKNSTKTLICGGLVKREGFERDYLCGREMRVSSFKPTIL